MSLLPLRILAGRLRQAAHLTLLRLTGLVLAVTLAAAIPTFVSASMERVLQPLLAQREDPLAVLVGWRAAEAGEYTDQVAALDRYLREEWPRQAGLSAEVTALPSSRQTAVQRVGEEGRLLPAKRYLRLAPLPDQGLTLATGRWPEAGAAEVVLPAAVASRYDYPIGAVLRVAGDEGALSVTVVGTVQPPESGPLAHLSGALDGALLTSGAFWEQQQVALGEVSWVLLPETSQVRTAGIPSLLSALADLPLRVSQRLGGAEVLVTPITWIASFAQQVAQTRRFLLVLLTPVFLLVLFFVIATANVLVEHRRVEVVVLRSRGMSPLRVVGHFLPESALLASVALFLGMALVGPLVRLMGLSAGFLQLVGRPALPVQIDLVAVGYGLTAALLAEAASLWPLLQAVRLTVVTMRQEAITRSPALEAVQGMAELLLLALVGYATWRLQAGEGGGSEPLHLALPALFLVGAGLITLRLFRLLTALLWRGLGTWLSPSLSLAAGWLHNHTGRYRSLSLMLVITLGLGVYGAAFARTLERDLAARTLYRVGADLVLQPSWEVEVEEWDSTGSPLSYSYKEPPYSALADLPGVAARTQVQTRKQAALSAGGRNLGKADLLGIQPQSFGRVATFLTELTPQPREALEALGREERGVLLSQALAERTRLAPGDRLQVTHNDASTELVVVGVLPHWPGRLPEDGEFLVANLPFLQDELALAPYAVWFRLEPGADLAAIAAALQERAVRLSSASDYRSVLAEGRRNPFRLGIYATLSAGFAVALLVMALTYLLSVGLTLQGRAKELGVLRAMGLSPGEIALALYSEQFLRTGVSALVGLLAGAQAAALYLPVLRQQPGETLLPLRLATTGGDQITLLATLGVTLAIGLLVVAVWMRRLNLQAVLRLGEDS